jgi:putative ATPase
MKDLDYGKDYKYPHDYPGNWVEQSYLPKALLGKQIYKPGKNKREES